MKNKILLSIVILMLPLAVISFFKKETNFKLAEKKEEVKQSEVSYQIKLQNENGEITNLDLEKYVIGVVAGEMPASFELEALKAQAIASRTYAMYKKSLNQEYDVLATTADQVYLTLEQMQEKWQNDYEEYYNKIKEAVYQTRNLVLKYNNEIIKSYYFAMSNGYTEEAVNVFNESQDYLVSVESKGEEEISDNVIKTISMSKTEFCQKLNIECQNIKITDINYSISGRINNLKINNTQFLGTKLRSLLNLRSTDFQIEVADNEVLITTKGYGHGVGMSQYGANAMAKNGSSYEEILKHYYQNVTINQI